MCLIKFHGTNSVLLQGILGVDGVCSFYNPKLQNYSFVLMSSSKPFSGSTLDSSWFTVVRVDEYKANVVEDSCSTLLTSSNVSLWYTRLGHPNNCVLQFVMTL